MPEMPESVVQHFAAAARAAGLALIVVPMGDWDAPDRPYRHTVLPDMLGAPLVQCEAPWMFMGDTCPVEIARCPHHLAVRCRMAAAPVVHPELQGFEARQRALLSQLPRPLVLHLLGAAYRNGTPLHAVVLMPGESSTFCHVIHPPLHSVVEAPPASASVPVCTSAWNSLPGSGHIRIARCSHYYAVAVPPLPHAPEAPIFRFTRDMGRPSVDIFRPGAWRRESLDPLSPASQEDSEPDPDTEGYGEDMPGTTLAEFGADWRQRKLAELAARMDAAAAQDGGSV